MTKKPVTLAVVGAGMRGTAYAKYALEHPDLAKVVAVAEPRAFQREALAKAHNIPAQCVFSSWEDFAAAPRLADAVIIGTQDRMHVAPVLALAPKGYAILLEKPISVNLDEGEQVIACVKRHGNIFAVCYVLLYTDFTMRLRAMIDSGVLGKIVSIQHFEPVGWWHQAHSFVRGNWAKQNESSFMLLAKCCHDVDWLRHIMGQPCRRVASFGSLRHFKASERPAAAADRCLDCSIEPTCPYSAKRFYLDQFGRDAINEYCVAVITDDHSQAGVVKALREGPYGRCVYACDNDVVDNQVAIFEFADGSTASLTMTAFCPFSERKTRLCGTRGYIDADGVQMRHFDFVSEKTEVIDTRVIGDASKAAVEHGGGDHGVIKAFVEAVATGDQTKVWSGPDESLISHRMVFAAERARCEGRVVEV
jgi:predicted dehydrogenase